MRTDRPSGHGWPASTWTWLARAARMGAPARRAAQAGRSLRLVGMALTTVSLGMGCGGQPGLRLVGYADPYFPEVYRLTPVESAFRDDATGDCHLVCRLRQVEGPARLEGTHLLRVRVFGRPAAAFPHGDRGTVNARIDYVIIRQDEVLRYAGLGFVYPTRILGGDSLRFSIEQARLTPENRRDDDPLGSPTLDGSVQAGRDPARTVELEREVDRHPAGTGVP